ncbi:LOW QUALITY PROTEIN: uncharacterized protein LOC114950019 [Acropora millepora]|uniref:LOW QUALITY PROTEIN: uncharacterized protein LOC114950019 n=1 Tax=Acropora millepora TaxID=45264 RepID=UPI001CF1C566|nr:LOW QUALITY PROTEIN: uncharacterized protein LOC114950019 [Acropora millepora]
MKGAFNLWNVSALSVQQTLTCKMTCKLAILFIVICLHSTHSQVDATPLVIEPELPINCPIIKCSAGYHSVCQSNGQPRCKQCSDGCYSPHASRIKECLRCSHCGENEFEVQPCSPTTNVVCQKCRECYSPFPFVLKSCTRTSDTICGNCSSALGLECEEEKNPEETSARSTLETNKAAGLLPQKRMSPTRTFTPFSNPSTKKKEIAAHSETKKLIRNKRWDSKNETANMTAAAGAGVISSPHFEQDNRTSYNFSLHTYPSMMPYSESSHHSFLIILLSILVPFVILCGVLSFFFAKGIKRTRCIPQGHRGHLLRQAEQGVGRSRSPQSRKSYVLEFVSSTTAWNEDQIDKQATCPLNSTETNDPATSSTRNTIINYLSEDAKSVCGVFPDVQCICLGSELLFVTSAHGSFDNTGGTLTHPDSDVCINIEPGTFPDGNQQPIFFHVIYNDTYVIRDIPETKETTLISPVIKCGPDDINPQKAMEIVVPHCLYVDEVKKGSIAVYRCEQFTNEGPQSWKKIPSSSERSCHCKAWFSVKKDSIIIKTKVFSIWSIFVCGGGSKRKRVTAFASKPNPASNLIFLRCYIYSDNEDSKRKVQRFEEEHFPGSKSSSDKHFRLYSDNQDINVWLDKNALTKKGWTLDETPALQIRKYEMAYRNGFRCKSACEFAVKPIEDCSTRVKDFSCLLYFRQIDHPEDSIYVNPGFPLLPLPTTSEENGERSNGAQNSSQFVIPEDLARRFDEPVTREDCIRLCYHIVNDWKMILRHLGVEEAVLDNVSANHTKANEKSYQGLLEWTRLAGTQRATIGNLCNALKTAGCTEAIEKLSSRDDGARLHGHAIRETTV